MFHKFRRLNLGMMIPELNYTDFHTLVSIACCRENCAANGEEVKVSMLTRTMEMAPTAVSRSLKSLEQRKYIQRTVSDTDRRYTYVQLTPEGEKALEQAQDAIDNYFAAVFEKFGADNIENLLKQLNQLYHVAAAEIEQRKCSRKEDIKHE